MSVAPPRPHKSSGEAKGQTALPSSAGYSFALIVIDRAAFSYQSSDLKTFGRLTGLRSTPFVFLDRELGDLRSNFGDASTFTTAKYLLPPRTKYPPDQRRFISRALGVSKQLAVEASIAPSRP
jgi:hypothetical protein